MREMIFLLVLLALPAASYFFVFQPRNAQIADARREVAQKQAKLEQLEAATRNIADLGTEIDKLSEAIDLFEQKLPAEREVEVILKQVWELAAKHKLTPKSIRTDKPVPSAGYSELPIRLTISGDFDGFYSFLLDLEKLKRITRVPQMQIKKVPLEEGQMQADVVLSIFFEAQDKSDTGKGRI
jgi:type IV pilus assembly protein PilO